MPSKRTPATQPAVRWHSSQHADDALVAPPTCTVPMSVSGCQSASAWKMHDGVGAGAGVGAGVGPGPGPGGEEAGVSLCPLGNPVSAFTPVA